LWLRDQLPPDLAALHLSTIVQQITWQQGHVQVMARRADGATPPPFTAPRVIITLPLGVLKAPPDHPATVRISPELPDFQQALQTMQMGHVVRVALRFRERIWTHAPLASSVDDRLEDLSFLFMTDEPVPTWWTQYPLDSAVITGWIGGQRAQPLLNAPNLPQNILDAALSSLTHALKLDRQYIEAQLLSWHFHNWSADPFALGAYSYGGVGSVAALPRLAAPIHNTLYFAGEAMDIAGYNGTVHGAIASGERAADAILGAS
jgi:monoamine oxidase